LLEESASSNTGVEVIRIREMYEQAIREKESSEEALRMETLANEEQRNYIQILRHAVEAKLEGLGITELVRKS
jgi:hypothetical protein